MNIGIYNTYFEGNGWGGGERYMLSAAAHWSLAHSVSCFVQDPQALVLAGQKFSLDVSRLKAVPNVFQHSSLVGKLVETAKYDVLFVLTDGSVPTSLAKHNIFHIQAPYSQISAQRLALSRYQTIVCNSTFTKEHLEPALGNKSFVIYPPVDVGSCSVGAKDTYVLSVGRFHNLKKFEILIDAMKELSEIPSAHGWRLVLAGGYVDQDSEYMNLLKKKAHGLPVEFMPNISHSELMKLYSNASIYWHAAGYGEVDPVKMEHFGIAVVEAMASGAIPIVVGKGGPTEIVRPQVDGFHWNTTQELLHSTQQVIETFAQLGDMQKSAQQRAQLFSTQRFNARIDELLSSF